MSSEIKIVAVSKDGAPILVGQDFHKLEDKTTLTLETKDIDSFLKFLTNLAISETEDVRIKGAIVENPINLFFNHGAVCAFRQRVDYTSEHIARCTLEESPLLGLIRNRVAHEADPDTFEVFLHTMRDYYNIAGHELYNSIRNLTVKKITKVERRKDNHGNFCLAITRGKAENGEVIDVEPDITVEFVVPLFSMMVETIRLTFDVHMSYKEAEDGVAIGYRLVSPLFEEIIKEEKRKVIIDRLKDEPFPKFYGSPKIVRATNEWRFLSNGIAT